MQMKCASSCLFTRIESETWYETIDVISLGAKYSRDSLLFSLARIRALYILLYTVFFSIIDSECVSVVSR